jgi:methyl-accepting chemotaxis protein
MSDQNDTAEEDLEFDKKVSFGIKAKIAILICFSLVLCIATTIAVSTWLNSQLVLNNYKKNANTITAFAAQHIPTALRFGRVDPINETFQNIQERTEGTANAFVVLDKSGRVLTSQGDDVSDLARLENVAQERLAAPADAPFSIPDIEITAVPVTFGPEADTVGVLAIHWDTSSSFDNLKNSSIASMIAASAIAILGVGLSVILISKLVTTPILSLTSSMERIAAGDLNADVSGTERSDEVGVMAQRLLGFRETLATEAAQRQERQELDQAKSKVFKELSRCLSSVAGGDMTPRIDAGNIQDIDPQYGQVCDDFNNMVDAFVNAINNVLASAEMVKSNALEISEVSKEQSSRSESQATTLERSAQALQALTDSVRASAENAAQADEFITENRRQAETSGELVAQTIGAMRKIEKSSEQINDIITVIDDIAFQTNLLALNAGVEAARAGDAGRGFAVVASEVRALAQRASHSASEIKDLIANSTQHVSEGGSLVTDTGDALQTIIVQVSRVSELVSSIAQSSQEQSESLEQISQSVSEVDRTTQQNVAIIEETSASSQSLSIEAQNLRSTLSHFKTGQLETSQSKKFETDDNDDLNKEPAKSQIERQNTHKQAKANEEVHDAIKSEPIIPKKQNVDYEIQESGEWSDF